MELSGAERENETTVIARFNLPYLLLLLCLSHAACGWFWWLIFHDPLHVWREGAALYLILPPCHLFAVWASVIAFRNHRARGDVAIWIEGDRLLYSGSRTHVVPLDQIASVEAVDVRHRWCSRTQTIWLRLRDGRSRDWATSILRPSRSELIRRLRAAATNLQPELSPSLGVVVREEEGVAVYQINNTEALAMLRGPRGVEIQP